MEIPTTLQQQILLRSFIQIQQTHVYGEYNQLLNATSQLQTQPPTQLPTQLPTKPHHTDHIPTKLTIIT